MCLHRPTVEDLIFMCQHKRGFKAFFLFSVSFLYLVRVCDGIILTQAAQLTTAREAFIVFVSSCASVSPALTFALGWDRPFVCCGVEVSKATGL